MGHRILLVEDHHDTATVFGRMLRRDGYEVSVAGSAGEASRLCEHGKFDLLICDINLPDGEGSEVLKTARKSHPQTIGVIVSGHDEAEPLQRARDVGFARIFLKPIDFVALRHALRELLAGEPGRDIGTQF